MKAFKFNKYQVCENPIREVIYKDKRMRAIIETAYKDGEWAYGYTFKIEGRSVGCFHASGAAAFGEYRHTYPTQDAARTRAIKAGIACFKKQRSKYSSAKVLKALQSALNPQLSLF